MTVGAETPTRTNCRVQTALAACIRSRGLANASGGTVPFGGVSHWLRRREQVRLGVRVPGVGREHVLRAIKTDQGGLRGGRHPSRRRMTRANVPHRDAGSECRAAHRFCTLNDTNAKPESNSDSRFGFLSLEVSMMLSPSRSAWCGGRRIRPIMSAVASEGLRSCFCGRSARPHDPPPCRRSAFGGVFDLDAQPPDGDRSGDKTKCMFLFFSYRQSAGAAVSRKRRSVRRSAERERATQQGTRP